MNPIRPEETGSSKVKQIITVINHLIERDMDHVIPDTEISTCIRGREIKKVFKSEYGEDIGYFDINAAMLRFSIHWNVNRQPEPNDNSNFDYYMDPK